MLGYLDDPELTAASYDADGYFLTGDLARERADGFVELIGRAKELIVRGGHKISPLEVERLYLEHPDVGNALATGVADERLGEAIHVLIVPRPGAAPAAGELRAWAEGRIDGYKRPDAVHVGDALPTGRTGKADRRALRATDRAWGAVDLAGFPPGSRPARPLAEPRHRADLIGRVAAFAQVPDREAVVALGEALSLVVGEQRVVAVFRHVEAEQRLEQAVNMGRLEQVGAAGDQAHPLDGVVDRDREVVAGGRVLAGQHRVAEDFRAAPRPFPSRARARRAGLRAPPPGPCRGGAHGSPRRRRAPPHRRARGRCRDRAGRPARAARRPSARSPP